MALANTVEVMENAPSNGLGKKYKWNNKRGSCQKNSNSPQWNANNENMPHKSSHEICPHM